MSNKNPEEEGKEPWACILCTFVNPPQSRICQGCTADHPKNLDNKTKQSAHLSEDSVPCKFCLNLCNIYNGICDNCGKDLFEPDTAQTPPPPPKKTQSSKPSKPQPQKYIPPQPTLKPASHPKPKPQQLIPKPGLCLLCTYENPPDAQLCSMCDGLLQSMKFMIACPYCQMLCNKSNTNCVACRMELPLTEYNKEVFRECPVCLGFLDFEIFDRHLIDCKEGLWMRSNIKEEDFDTLSEDCPYCSKPFINFGFKEHLEICTYLPEYYHKKELFGRLDPAQVGIIKFMHQNSCKLHFSARIPLQRRLAKLGFSVDDMHRLYQYTYREVPLIVHVHISKHMALYLKDTHYRNQFETGKSSGCTDLTKRSKWETRMFFKKYDKMDKTLRVKYGTVNLTNDPKGVNACRYYGNSYFLLKKHVRDRCTITDKDSSQESSLIGTFKFCYHILNRLSDQQLKAAIRAAKGEKVSSSVTSTYKEIQIHGPLEFGKDIEKLYVNENEYNTQELKDLVKSFSNQFGVAFELFKL